MKLEKQIIEGPGFKLVPLTQDAVESMHALADDPDVVRFTYVSASFDRAKATAWVQRYVDGWEDGTCAGFSVQGLDGEFWGMASIIHLELEERQGEIGYIIAPAARGRGVATEAVKTLTEWGYRSLGLERLELKIDPTNQGSIRVAERAGYTYEGTLRSLYFKDGQRGDTAIYSRLPADAPA